MSLKGKAPIKGIAGFNFKVGPRVLLLGEIPQNTHRNRKRVRSLQEIGFRSQLLKCETKLSYLSLP
jgi:G:T-mismatch repair DNA endonuclease (very short patch repair protein)